MSLDPGRSNGTGTLVVLVYGMVSGRYMLNRKSKLPSEVTMPTSPISMPFFLYSIGRFACGWGNHRGKPCPLERRRHTYQSFSVRWSFEGHGL